MFWIDIVSCFEVAEIDWAVIIEGLCFKAAWALKSVAAVLKAHKDVCLYREPSLSSQVPLLSFECP